MYIHSCTCKSVPVSKSSNPCYRATPQSQREREIEIERERERERDWGRERREKALDSDVRLAKTELSETSKAQGTAVETEMAAEMVSTLSPTHSDSCH